MIFSTGGAETLKFVSRSLLWAEESKCRPLFVGQIVALQQFMQREKNFDNVLHIALKIAGIIAGHIMFITIIVVTAITIMVVMLKIATVEVKLVG
jgi:hypothetical protein